MKIGFTAFGVEVTIVDLGPVTEEECKLARWDELMLIDDPTDEEVYELDELTEELGSSED